MAWLPRELLADRIAKASEELKAARRDGSAERILKAAGHLDFLIDQLPRAEPKALPQPQEG